MKIFVICLTVLIALNVFAEEKVISCIKISKPPKIDGKLDDEVWSKCEKATEFVYNFEEEISKGGLEGKLKELHGKPALHQTTAYIAYDEKNLYLAFRAEEPNPSNLKANAAGPDDQVWNDDCVEFFIDTDNSKKSYYHIIINSQGVQFDQYVKSVGKGKKGETKLDADVRWNVEGDIKALVEESCWNVEASFLLSSFKLEPKPGLKCGVNFAREQYTYSSIPNSYSVWAPIAGTFHQPDKFGTLIFK